MAGLAALIVFAVSGAPSGRLALRGSTMAIVITCRRFHPILPTVVGLR